MFENRLGDGTFGNTSGLRAEAFWSAAARRRFGTPRSEVAGKVYGPFRATSPLSPAPPKDKEVEQIYCYRWWTYRKHIKATPAGFVVTEFIRPVNWARIYNTISCAFGHHVAEGRWLADQRILDDYTRFWFRGNHGKRPVAQGGRTGPALQSLHFRRPADYRPDRPASPG